ncbi:MAG: hypothetical protein HZA78_07040 [Candidatus Schekmanbacteria bacterium]|nr:hypothetical protein [Candidatus Schekmanbacteria bacterium]
MKRLVFFFIFICLVQLVLSYGSATTQPTVEEGHMIEELATERTVVPKPAEEIHEPAEDSEGNHATPYIYYLNWGFLGFTFIAACFYCLWVYEKGRPKNEGQGLPALFIILVIAMYTLNQMPEVQRHFDLAKHSFVDGYHESTTIAFFKFFYKMALGVFLMIYGLIGREHH